jgi:hypothetical protein
MIKSFTNLISMLAAANVSGDLRGVDASSSGMTEPVETGLIHEGATESRSLLHQLDPTSPYQSPPKRVSLKTVS